MAETIFITGGTSGIGEALARAFLARGASVIVSGRNTEALARLARECPGIETLLMDVADQRSVQTGTDRLAAQHPTLSTVINNAGIQNLLDFTAETLPDLQEIDAEIETNLKGLIHVTRALLPQLKRQPRAAGTGQLWPRLRSAGGGTGLLGDQGRGACL